MSSHDDDGGEGGVGLKRGEAGVSREQVVVVGVEAVLETMVSLLVCEESCVRLVRIYFDWKNILNLIN